MVLVNMLMKIGPPTKEEALMMTMASISPSRREIPPTESLCRRAKGPLPSFPPQDSDAYFRKYDYDLFFLGQNTPYRRRGGFRRPVGTLSWE